MFVYVYVVGSGIRPFVCNKIAVFRRRSYFSSQILRLSLVRLSFSECGIKFNR